MQESDLCSNKQCRKRNVLQLNWQSFNIFIVPDVSYAERSWLLIGFEIQSQSLLLHNKLAPAIIKAFVLLRNIYNIQHYLNMPAHKQARNLE